MTPRAFITKWKAANLKERSASQEHFLDLCRLLDEPTPADVDPEGAWYCFERGASKLSGGDGWADVWKRGHFSWEYKGKHKDLQAAYVQLQQYSVALENPPLLTVCDLERFRIHTNWTNTIQSVYDFTLDDLHEPEQRQQLKWVFSDPERLRPGKTRQMLTEEAAQQFASLAQRLRVRGHAPQTVAHFINRLVFCMFAEDIGLLPNAMFSRMLEHAVQRPEEFVDLAQDLFRAMRSGGRVGFEHLYRGRVPPEGDLVTYWFEKARAHIASGQTTRAGLVATNSIRGGANRRVLDRIVSDIGIFEAWSDEPWVVDGASVRVSLICFGATDDAPRLDGGPASRINPDLTAGDLNLTTATCLKANQGVSFMGDTKGGAFDVPGTLARAWLQLPTNPNGKKNAEVLRPWRNGQDITRRSADKWVIDFGWGMGEQDASLFEAPFGHITECVWPERSKNRRESYRMRWWRHVEPRPALMNKLAQLQRYIVTPRVAKHRMFVWLSSAVMPDCQLIAITRDDDTTFGILHSRFHEAWTLRLCTWLGVGNDPRYTPSTTFETFPFPDGLTPDIPATAYADDPRAQKIAAAARRLNELRNNWLNPSDLVMRVPEVVEGYPDRILPKDEAAAELLKKRTLTNLYNERPAWLAHAHRALDEAVAHAYGWPPEMSEDAMLAKLVTLNVERAKERPEEARSARAIRNFL